MASCVATIQVTLYCGPVKQRYSGTKQLCDRLLKRKWTTLAVQIKMLAVATCVVNKKWSTGDLPTLREV